MKAIIFLGNPGRKYAQTRHNVAWLFADYLVAQWQCDEAFSAKSKFSAEILDCTFAEHKLLLAKPTTYMNRSGQAVLAIKQFHRLQSSDLLIIHDDKDLPLGTVRLRNNSGAGGHNGMQDIIDRLGTNTVSRLKVGVDSEQRDAHDIDTAAFVLAPFTPPEREMLTDAVFPEVQKLLEDWLVNTTHT